MKKLIYIVAAITAAAIVSFCIYSAYMNSSEPLPYDQIKYNGVAVNSDGFFSGNFKCEADGKLLNDWDYELKGTTLYFTLYSTATGRDALASNSEGYTNIKFFVGKNVKKIYYINGEKKTEVKFENETKK